MEDQPGTLSNFAPMDCPPGSIAALRARIARELEVEVERLTQDARFVGDLGLSSVNAIVVVMSLEEWFGIQISEDEAQRLCTLGDVLEFLNARGVPLASNN